MQKRVEKIQIHKKALAYKKPCRLFFLSDEVCYRIQKCGTTHVEDLGDSFHIWLEDNRKGRQGWSLPYVKNLLDRLSMDGLLQERDKLSVEYIEGDKKVVVKLKQGSK